MKLFVLKLGFSDRTRPWQTMYYSKWKNAHRAFLEMVEDVGDDPRPYASPEPRSLWFESSDTTITLDERQTED